MLNKIDLENLLEKAEEAEFIYKNARKRMILSAAMVALSMAGITIAIGFEDLTFFIIPSLITSISAAVMSAGSGKKYNELHNMGFRIKKGKLTLSETLKLELNISNIDDVVHKQNIQELKQA